MATINFAAGSAAGLNETTHRIDHGGAPSAPDTTSTSRLSAITVERLRRAAPRVAVAAIAALASTALVIAYGKVLSAAGVAAPTLALLAVLLASTLSSIGGFAFSAICGVMLLQIMSDPVQVVEIMMICSIAMQSLSVAVLCRDIDGRRLLTFLLGGILGLPIGVWLLLHLGYVGFRSALGILLIAYAAYALLKRPVTITWGGKLAEIGAGFLSGITGGLAGFPSTAVMIWCSLRGWDKRRQRGIYQPFILIMQIMALGLIQLMRTAGANGPSLGWGPLAFIPTALLGTWFGLAIFGRMSDRGFAVVVNLLLLVSGLGLLV